MTTICRMHLAMAAILCPFLLIGRSVAAPTDGTTSAESGRAAKSPSLNNLKPSIEMQSLTKVIEGRWSTEISYAPGDATSPNTLSHGEQVWRTGPGGFTLLEEERIGSGSEAQFLLAVHWWDKEAKRFKGLLCNNSGPGACNIDTYYNSSLEWDGKTLTIDLDFTQGAKKMRWHEVFSDFTSNSFTQTGDMGDAGGPLKRILIIHAKRSVNTQ